MLVKMTNWQFVSNSLNPSDIKFAPFGGFTPRTMSFYKYGRKNFFPPIRSGFGPFGSRRSWTISGDWNLLLVSLQLTPLHGSERPLAKRAVFESRFVPMVVIPSSFSCEES